VTVDRKLQVVLLIKKYVESARDHAGIGMYMLEIVRHEKIVLVNCFVCNNNFVHSYDVVVNEHTERVWVNICDERSPDGLVSTVVKLRAGILGSDPRKGQGFFLLPIASRHTLEFSQPHIQWVPWALSPEREADPELTSNAKVKNAGSYISILHLRDIFTF
jgi:hypothetical protein